MALSMPLPTTLTHVGALVAVLLKLGPDGNAESRAHLARVAMAAQVDGIVISNTSAERPDTLASAHRAEKGGLSGAPLRAQALRACAELYVLTEGKLPIIGVGGIDSGAAAYERIRAGASLLQLYTALVYSGPGLVDSIHAELRERLEADGFATLGDAVGVDAARIAAAAAAADR